MILRALFLASFAIVASVPIHSSCSRCEAGGGGIVACGWLIIPWVMMGWVRHVRLFFIMHIVLRIRW